MVSVHWLALMLATAQVGCASGGDTSAEPRGADSSVGPLVIIGTRETIGRPRDAFGRHGYKLPVMLPEGVTATLSSATRGVGFVFTPGVQKRTWTRGVSAASPAVRFTACEGDRSTLRTGWPGGIVVDRPKCATLVIKVEEGLTERHRVPLGRKC
jgi:hypothetical protein